MPVSSGIAVTFLAWIEPLLRDLSEAGGSLNCVSLTSGSRKFFFLNEGDVPFLISDMLSWFSLAE